jgi:hypothetical protein
MSNVLNEGLRAGDLEDLVYPVFEVDKFKSKMGQDADVCTITFQAKDRYPAKDMMEYVEKTFPFVLDADVASGENEKGEYSIFVEVERTDELAENISDIIYGLRKVTSIKDWKFRYYKDKQFKSATLENLKDTVPSNSKIYENKMKKYKEDELKEFFNKTVLDDLVLENEDTIIIKKPFGVEIKLQKVSDQNILETNAPAVDDKATSEIFWLTKVLGDYGINKFGDSFLFNNGSETMLVKRI